MSRRKKKSAKKPDPFVESDQHVLFGKKLEPWTAKRYITAQAMGMVYPDIDFKLFMKRRTYPGLIRDMIVCLWLCTVDKDRVKEAGWGPEEAYEEAEEWGETNGVHRTNSPPYVEAYSKFLDILAEVNKAATKPVGTGAAPEPDDGDESGND